LAAKTALDAIARSETRDSNHDHAAINPLNINDFARSTTRIKTGDRQISREQTAREATAFSDVLTRRRRSA
jgi:hypothetical protein